MFKVMRTKDGGFCIEIEACGALEEVSDSYGTTAFIYCSKKQADDLAVSINQELIDDGIKNILRSA